MKALVEIIGFMTLTIAVIFTITSIRNYYLSKKIKKLQKNRFLELIKTSPNSMSLHLQKVANLANIQLKISKNPNERAQILDDYHFYVGIYDKIKTNQELSDNELVTFSKFYLDFTKIIQETEKENKFEQNKIKELFNINLN